jgi:uncharacterized DUF497 family protein
MPTPTWDPAKRASNLAKHGLDFLDAAEVLQSQYRFDVPVIRASESRTLSIFYARSVLRVLAVVHTSRSGGVRIISFRQARKAEREAYLEWLESIFDES